MKPLVSVSIALLLCSACSLHPGKPPLRASELTIRDWLLHQIPLGSPSDRVDTFIRDHHLLKYTECHGQECSSPMWRGLLGSHIISMELGRYQGFPWVRVVAARWSFDAEDKLIDVKVDKGSDAI